MNDQPLQRVREDVARIIDPEAWVPEDRRIRNGFGPNAPDFAIERRVALAKADAILALPALQVQGGWRTVSEAPHACHVLATRFDEAAGEWVTAVVLSPPTYPFTRWQPLPEPPLPSGEAP